MSNFISKKISDFTALTYNELYDNKDNLVLLLSEPGVNNYKVNISELTLALEENIKHELDSELLSYTHELGSKIDNIETNYATKEYINSEINKLNSYIDNIENNYATQEYIDNEINNINSYIDNIENNYATQEYVNNEINKIDTKFNGIKNNDRIIINGGPLATDDIKNIFKNSDGISEIPKDITLYELLTKLFCQEIWPSNINSYQGKVTINTPTLSISDINSYVEVGEDINVTLTFNNITYTAQQSYISGFTYGYFDNNETYNSNTSINIIPNVTFNGNYTYSYIYKDTNFSGNCEYNSKTTINLSIKAAYGNNSLTIETSTNNINASYNISNIPVSYAASNLKNNAKIKDNNTNLYASVEEITSYNITYKPSKTVNKTWIGVYPILFNGIEYDGAGTYNGIIPEDNVDGNIKKSSIINTNIYTYIKFPGQGNYEIPWNIYINKNYTEPSITAYAFNPNNGQYDKNAYKIFTKTTEIYEFNSEIYNIYQNKGTDGSNGLELFIVLK